jgi:NAD(P)-dependent dehydrogenase (short-subunit alcohol dehydrogenase family)
MLGGSSVTEPASDAIHARPCGIILGAGSRVGESFSRKLLAQGLNLILADSDEIALARFRAELGVATIACDVLSERSLSGLFEQASARFGHIDLLINSAGTGYVRTLGVMRASREFAKCERRRTSCVVNIAPAPDASESVVTYAGSPVAFSRLARGMADVITTPLLHILTFDRLRSEAAIAEVAELVMRELEGGGAAARPGS